MSGDGSKVVGNCIDAEGVYSSFMVWSDATTSAAIRFGRSRGAMAEAVNFDGSVVVGIDEQGPVRVEKSRVEVFDSSIQSIHFVSDDGMVVGGLKSTGSGTRGFVARSRESVIEIPALSANSNSHAGDISGDGLVVVGASGSDQSPDLYRPLRWTAELGSQALPSPRGLKAVVAQFVDAHGAVIVGYGSDSNDMLHTVRWTDGEPTEVAELAGKLPCALSSDGSTIAYTAGSSLGVFDAQHGDRDLRQLVEASGVDLSGWELNSIYGASADAQVLVAAATYRAGDGRPRPVVFTLAAASGSASP